MHLLLSPHGFVLFVCTQPVPGVQLSVVHGLPSSQDTGVLTHVPPEQVPDAWWHRSVTVHELVVFWQLPVALHAWQVPQPVAGALQQNPSVHDRPAVH